MVETSGAVGGIRETGLTASVSPLRQTMAAYASLSEQAMTAPPQTSAWIESWNRQAQVDAILVTVSQGGQAVLMLALAVRRRGPFTIAEFVGGTHANGNFPVCAAEFPTDGAHLAELIARALRSARPDIDLVLLERQLDSLDGRSNPFDGAPLSAISPNVALAVDLQGGFEGVLERTNRKRKLKKHRAQLRKFEDAGGWRRIEATTEAEVRAFLDAFFAMRAHRFRQQGIADVFAPPLVQTALAALYTDALSAPRPAFVLHALEVGGKIRAVTGSARCGRRIVCDFTAFGDDELAATAPGDFLAFENIRAACEEGFDVFDFSVGDERYKRSWCDVETFHRDVYLPVTLRGRALAAGEIAVANAKRRIKENRTLWALAKRVRGMRGTSANDD